MHPLVPHRDAVGHRDGAELQRVPATGVHALLGALREPVERQVARRDLVPRVGDADLRLAEVPVAHPDGPQHAARRRRLQPVRDLARPRFELGSGLSRRYG
jgi:hypothetical protein